MEIFTGSGCAGCRRGCCISSVCICTAEPGVSSWFTCLEAFLTGMGVFTRWFVAFSTIVVSVAESNGFVGDCWDTDEV